jgi:sugar phosphate isomerase/epimerase
MGTATSIAAEPAAALATDSEQPALLASCWTTAGDTGPAFPDQRGRFPLEDRIRLAAQAGYAGFGLVHADLMEARDRMGYRALGEVLASYGITTVEVEMLNDWYATGPARTQSDAVRRDLLAAAAALGARHVKAGADLDTDHPPEFQRVVTEFAELCRQAEASGTRIALEPMPFTNVPDLAVGCKLVDEAAHPAGALMIDLWHVVRSGTPYGEVASLPARYVFAVELDDAPAQVVGTLLEDTLDRRALCGEGDQDVVGFVSAVMSTGFAGPWGVEILSEEFRKLDLWDQVMRSYRTARTVLDLAAR